MSIRFLLVPLALACGACASTSRYSVAPSAPPADPASPRAATSESDADATATPAFDIAPAQPFALQSGASETTVTSTYPPRFGISVHGMVLDDLDGEIDIGGTSLDGSVDAEGLGAQFDFFSYGASFLLGFDKRTYEDDNDSNEAYAGARYFFGHELVRPFIEGQIRYGDKIEIDNVGDTDSFWGWAAGPGVSFWPTDQFFIDVKAMYEDQFEDIELPGGAGDLRLNGWTGTVGVGFAF